MKPSDARACCARNYTDLIERLAASPDTDHNVIERLRKHTSSLGSCGKPLALPDGEVTFWCRRPVCGRCSAFWSRQLASNLFGWCPDAEHADFRIAGLTLGDYSTAADAFIAFQGARRHLGQRLYDLRETSLYKAHWSRFAAVGALVIDFANESRRGSAWIAKVRMAVHIGDLGNDDVRAFFELAGPAVDVQPMDTSETTQQAVQNILVNATTVRFASGQWPDEAIQEYLLACAQHASGRKGLKMAIKPRYFQGHRPSFLDGLERLVGRDGMSDIADENHRMVVSSINRYLAMEPLAMLVPGLDENMGHWLAENQCERKATIFRGSYVMFPDVQTQVAFKMRFGVGTRMVE